MPSKTRLYGLMILPGLILAGYQAAPRAAEFATLFTTPQERQIINSNRYKDDRPKQVEAEEVRIELPTQQLVKEEVFQEYRVSGISVAQAGTHSVWINSAVYEDGGQLEDSSTVKVLVGDEVRVRITAPDGKHYYATSGQTVEISYLVTVQN